MSGWMGVASDGKGIGAYKTLAMIFMKSNESINQSTDHPTKQEFIEPNAPSIDQLPTNPE